jgi:hypothetical protein
MGQWKYTTENFVREDISWTDHRENKSENKNKYLLGILHRK